MSEYDLRSFLAGVKPDWYRTKDLYPRYLAWAQRQGKDPASAKTLGEMIRRVLRPDRRYAHGHLSVWKITEEMTRGL